ncbi:MAG: endonuclease MutS2 [Ignavibacteriales bacterium]|nr:endonuclease MutS2 [Ignavibacteriales bacterium]
MIDENIYEKLEYLKILEFISKYSVTETGKSNILKLRPLDNVNEIKLQGELVSEAKEILIYEEHPLNYLPDLLNSIEKAKIENAVLDKQQILYILNLAENSRKIYSFIKKFEFAKNLSTHFLPLLFVDKNFEFQIKNIFNDAGELKDNASKELKRIREEIKSKNDTLQKIVSSLLKNWSKSLLVQEEIITLRDGRIVLPVKSEHKRHVKGFIHSESATGQTVYIEPEETLDINNDILSLHFEEKREIDRILKNVTKKIGEYSEQLKIALNAISQIDSIFSRAKYSIEIIGSFVNINNEKNLELIDGRHPILLKKFGRAQAVPLNIKLDDEKIIIITGPNAGGKTVVLKTIGLLTIMILSGIHIPAHPDSNIPVFSDMFLDIGDYQSLEDDLSTFSSHLKNIGEIVEKSNKNSLVLLDEIGTGTDPTEGSAISTGILLTLLEKKALTFATTHHGNLKILANDIKGFKNASMEFDTVNLQPTYNFKLGLPGSSYAFEIAERIGLNKELLKIAKEYIDTDKTKLENFLIDIEKKSRDLRETNKKLELENIRLSSLTKLYQEKTEEIQREKKKIILELKQKSEEYLLNISKEFERIVKEIRETQAKKEIIKEAKDKMEDIKKEVGHLITDEETIETKNEFIVGDYVSIKDTKTYGEIISINEKDETAILKSGIVKIKVKLSDIISAEKINQSNYESKNIEIKHVENKIDIRGRHPEEVENEIIKFLDDAYMSNLKVVEIIHGKGEGILKKYVHSLLKEYGKIKKYYFAAVEFGGEGVTIVEFD